MENEFNHTEEEVELPLIEDEESEISTDDDTAQESVETFDDALESAETDEDFAKLGEALKEEVTEPTEEAKEEIDTEAEEEPASDFSIGSGFKLKDGDIELTIQDEAKLRQLAQMGLNYGGKTTELAKHRSFIQYAEEHGISMEDVQMLADIKSGDKDAYSALAGKAGIDVYDVTEEHQYAPEPIVQQQTADPMVDMVAQEILSNEEHTSQFQKWLPHMPEEVRAQVTTDSNALRAVQADIQAGIFDKAMTQAYSDMRVNGVEFNQAYINAKQMLTATQVEPVRSQQPITRGERVRASANRGKASAPSKSYSSIADMTNDEFLNNFQDIIGGLERPTN